MSDLFVENSQKILITKALEEEFLGLESKVRPLNTQIDRVITHRQSEFIPQLINLKAHKSIAVRRKVALGLSKLKAQEYLESIKSWQIDESDRETWLNLASTIDKLERQVSSSSEETETSRILSVTEAINLVKKLIGEDIYTIEGEITEPKNYGSMFYLGLKDNQDIRLDCKIFAGHVSRLNFPLNEGLTVRATGKFTLSKSSRLSFDIQRMVLTGKGELLRNFQLLDEKLRLEGLYDPSNKKIIPQIPQNILLIASPNSAAIKDFTKVLSSRRTGINIFHLPIKTQGTGAELEILNQLENVNQICRENSIDTIVMTRGGGSKDDLFVFNSEKIVRAINNLNKPIIVAIGHEQDVTLAEKVADLRASTPSNAAELVSLSKLEILATVNYQLININNATQNRLASYQNFTNQQIQIISNNLKTQIDQTKQYTAAINNVVFSQIRSLKQEVNQLLNFAQITITNNFRTIKSELQYFRFVPLQVSQNINDYKRDFDLLKSQVELLDYKNILKRGYAIISQKGQIVENFDSFDINYKLKIEFSDGIREFEPKF